MGFSITPPCNTVNVYPCPAPISAIEEGAERGIENAGITVRSLPNSNAEGDMISCKTSPSENMRQSISCCVWAFVSAVVFLHLSAANAQSGGPFDLDWNTIDNGSVTSASGGPFTLSCTVGQPDADTAIGGPFTLDGGFAPGVSFAAAECVGDCKHDSAVTIDEIITGVNIALENLTVNACPAFDANRDGAVTINEIITGVNNALNSCPRS
jgi:hypothetical protein